VKGPESEPKGKFRESRPGVVLKYVYMVVWQMSEAPNYRTMVIDLGSRALFTSALMGFGTDQEGVLFDEATSHRVNR
jgi:hypothetical protein